MDQLSKNPLVSIVVITYNSEKYVLETLESVKAQTYHYIELIVSDDGSNDSTVEISQNWIKNNKERFVRAELITIEKNTGIPANCNRGVKAAQGEWVKLIAGDDALMDDCIKDNIEFINKNPHVNVLFSSVERYSNEFSREYNKGKIPEIIPLDFYGENVNAFLQYKKLLKANRVIAPSSFIKRSIIESVNYFDERFTLNEDYPMWLKLTRYGNKLYFMNKATIKYREHESSVYNFYNSNIIHPAYFRNETMRRILVYPNIPWPERNRRRLNYTYSKIIDNLGLNRKTKVNLFVYNLFIKYLNPFAYISYLLRLFKVIE